MSDVLDFSDAVRALLFLLDARPNVQSKNQKESTNYRNISENSQENRETLRIFADKSSF